jgi:hypothetical protein
VMVWASRSGLMGRFTRANGRRINRQVKASWSMLMVTSTRVIGVTTKRMAMVFTCMWMVRGTRGR